MSHSGCALVWHFQQRVVLFPCVTNDCVECVSYVLSYGQLQESWIISGLLWRNVNEYCLPSNNAHSPNYCSWLAVCVNYSANFYCKIELINRLKLHLIKTYSKSPKKQKNKQNVTRGDILMSPRVTVKRWTYDNAQRHVTVILNVALVHECDCDVRFNSIFTRQNWQHSIWNKIK